MIDVPVEVKDALRDGRLKKNYRIVVLKSEEVESFDKLADVSASYTIQSEAYYRIYSDTSNAISGVTITPSGGTAYQITHQQTPDGEPTILNLETLNMDAVVVLNDLVSASVELQFKTAKSVLVDDFTIDNNTLISESVSIDERMCSGDTIKFGLCEGSSLEFQYFNHENITDRQVQVFCDVEYGEENPYTIPMGFFTVKKCSRQASTGIIKATCYNKLQSAYLDQKANAMIDETFSGEVMIEDILTFMLDGYAIEKEKEHIDGAYKGGVYPHGSTVTNYARSTISTKHTTLYDVMSPLSPYDFWVYDLPYNTAFYISLDSGYFNKWDLDPDAYYIFEDYNNLVQLETDYYDWLVNLFDASALNQTTDSIMQSIITASIDMSCGQFFLGWEGAFSIRVIYQDDTEEFYSKIAYQNNLNKCVGPLEDFFHKTFHNVKKVEFILSKTLIQGVGGQGNQYTRAYSFVNIFDKTNYGYIDDHAHIATWNGLTLPNGQPLVFGSVGSVANLFNCYKVDVNTAEAIMVDVDTLPDVTLRELQTAIFETQAQFGQLDRVTDLFSGVELNHSRLYPLETLYPNNALYPDGAQASATKSMYSQLWADEGNVHKWRNLLITYKGLDENQQEKDFVYTAEVNPDGTDDYDCSDNWLFRNLVWTQAQIEEYADTMVTKMQDMTWFPFEMWCAGLPYLETGDEIEIPLGQNSYTSYVLQRQLKGIQNLQDTYINGTLDIF